MKLNFKTLAKNKDFRETIVIILIALVIYVGLRVAIQPYYIDGPSMEPNYWENERLLVDKLAYQFHAPTRGDIIVFHPPIPSTAPFIKRVIGLPGEKVEIRNGHIYIYTTDGSIITMQEPYVQESFTYSYTSSVIPANEYFVLGDNRDISEDSHYGWFAYRNKIIGEAWLAIWPPHLRGLAPIFRQPASATAIPDN
jgi:signal peptidase I